VKRNPAGTGLPRSSPVYGLNSRFRVVSPRVSSSSTAWLGDLPRPTLVTRYPVNNRCAAASSCSWDRSVSRRSTNTGLGVNAPYSSFRYTNMLPEKQITTT
jgi:hypothetical protein